MKINAKVDYACRAVLELALHWPKKEPLQLATIAKSQGIPENFLIHILLQLKQLGYVMSLRGKKGGYLLAQSPAFIKLSDIMKSFDQQSFLNFENQANNHNSVMQNVWDEVGKVVSGAMDQINFENIANHKRSKDNVVMFEI